VCAGSRAIEGRVLCDEWNPSFRELAKSSAPLESNTTWMLLVECDQEGSLLPIGTMSIADCLSGPSETLRCARRVCERRGVPIPEALTVRSVDQREGLWDVMQVSVLRGHRRTGGSPWLYHALYRASVEAGVARWVTNMTRREFDQLVTLGIPFVEVDGIRGTDWEAPEALDLGFQTIDVGKIAESMSTRIIELVAAHADESSVRWIKFADMASIVHSARRIKG